MSNAVVVGRVVCHARIGEASLVEVEGVVQPEGIWLIKIESRQI